MTRDELLAENARLSKQVIEKVRQIAQVRFENALLREAKGCTAMDLPLDQIICGDNCDVLGTLPRDCIDLVVTSPPYDDLRTYGGHSWDFYGVAWQLKRVLKPGVSLFG